MLNNIFCAFWFSKKFVCFDFVKNHGEWSSLLLKIQNWKLHSRIMWDSLSMLFNFYIIIVFKKNGEINYS